MAIGRTNAGGGGGGGGFTFKVVRYDTTPSGTAKENTIAVVSETAISGWVMQAEEPSVMAEDDGFVWIQVATQSDVAFYVDKKQYLKVYPKVVKQYVDGAWSNVEAYAYQSGEWVAFSSALIFLCKEGDECVAVTGGWAGANVKNNGDSLLFNGTINANSKVWFQTLNKISIQGKETLVFDMSTGNRHSYWSDFCLGISTSSKPTVNDFAAYVVPTEKNESLARQLVEVPISSVNGDYYIVCYMRNGNASYSNDYSITIYNAYIQ